MRMEEEGALNKTIAAAIFAAYGLPKPETEFRFHPERQWRFDFCWPSHQVALEVEGGAWTRGRHTRGKGFIADIEKYNEATIMGCRVLRCTPQQLESGEACVLVRRAMGLE